MFYVNKTIRIEEFIDSYSFDRNDLFNGDKTQLAKIVFTLAKFHSTALPETIPKISMIMNVIGGKI